jgi:hypothetical protein
LEIPALSAIESMSSDLFTLPPRIVFLGISVHRRLVVKRRNRFEGVRDRDANSAARTLTHFECNVVDFESICHCVFVYPRTVTTTQARDTRNHNRQRARTTKRCARETACGTRVACGVTSTDARDRMGQA